VLSFKVSTFIPNLVKTGQKRKERHQFSKFKMAAAATLDSDHQAYFVSTPVLLFKVATFLPNLVKIGLKVREQHQFRLRELNVTVIFTDKCFLHIRVTNIFTDKGFYR